MLNHICPFGYEEYYSGFKESSMSREKCEMVVNEFNNRKWITMKNQRKEYNVGDVFLYRQNLNTIAALSR